jgi:hypothetical protein
VERDQIGTVLRRAAKSEAVGIEERVREEHGRIRSVVEDAVRFESGETIFDEFFGRPTDERAGAIEA